MSGRQRRSSRAAAALLVFAGAVLAVTGAVGTVRSAQADTAAPFLGVYSLIGDSTGMIVSEDEPSANAHPEGQGSAPESSTSMTNGPVGYALSAVGWPGATVANAGGVVTLLFPGPIGNAGVPVPDAVTAAVDQAAALASYPMRAEARTGSQPNATFTAPGVDLRAHSDTAAVNSTAVLQSGAQPGTFGFGNAHTSSSSTLIGTVGQVTATSIVNDISIGGVVKIGSVTSTATGQTNGVRSGGSGGTLVNDMTIAGQPAYVDGSGLHFGKPGKPGNPATTQIAEQALSGAGMRIYFTEPQLHSQGPESDYTTGSLIFVWVPPNNPSNNVFTVSLGGSRVSVNGAQGAAFATPTTPVLPIVPGGTAGVVGSPPALAALPAPIPRSSPALAATPGPVATISTPPVTRLGGSALAGTFRGFGVGWAFAALIGAGMLLAGFRRMAEDVLDRPTGTCPLEVTR